MSTRLSWRMLVLQRCCCSLSNSGKTGSINRKERMRARSECGLPSQKAAILLDLHFVGKK